MFDNVGIKFAQARFNFTTEYSMEKLAPKTGVSGGI